MADLALLLGGFETAVKEFVTSAAAVSAGMSKKYVWISFLSVFIRHRAFLACFSRLLYLLFCIIVMSGEIVSRNEEPTNDDDNG